jgi:hypothetical protein
MVWSVIRKLRTGSVARDANPDKTEDGDSKVAKAQFYAMSPDLSRCRESVATRTPIKIIGLTPEGKVKVFSGVVQSIESGYTIHLAFPLRVTMPVLS